MCAIASIIYQLAPVPSALNGAHFSDIQWSQKISLLCIIAIIVAGALFIYTSFADTNMIWKDVYSQFFELIRNPEHFSPQFHNSNLQSSDISILFVLVIIFLGFHSMTSNVFYKRLDSVFISVFLTLASIGVITILLGIFHLNYQWIHILASLLLGTILNLVFHARLLNNIKSIRNVLRQPSSILNSFKISLRAITIVPVVLTFGVSIFYAILLPVSDFDALIYHAEMARILFNEHSFPLLSGPSIGIEISGNYPPLFSSIAGGLYTLFGRFDDIVIRILPAIFGIILLLGTYRISSYVFPKSGRFSVILLLSTPLFVHNLVITSPTSLIASSIALSVYSIVVLRNQTEYSDRYPLNHLFITGMLIGIALLSSYQSLYYVAIPAIVFLVLFYRSNRKTTMIAFTTVLIIALMFGSLWYTRNLIHHHNPFYPWLFSPTGEEERIFRETEKEIQTVGTFVTFGKFNYDAFDAPTLFRFHPALFPAFSSVSAIGLLILLYKTSRFFWLAAWVLLPILLILGLGTVFPRYLLPLLPPLIVSFGFIIAYTITRTRYRRQTELVCVSILLAIYILIGFPVALSNPAVNLGNYPDKMFFIKNAGNKDVSLAAYYDGDVEAWKWLRENADAKERIATFDPRTYYMGDYRNVFPLDGRMAVPLYSMSDSEEILQYLKQHNIKYIFDASSPNSPLYNMLPLSKELGKSQYPEIKSFGFAHIYIVNSTSSTGR